MTARIFALFFIAALTACGSGGDDGNPAPVPAPTPPPAGQARQGSFIDAAVQGLGFTSGSITGRTDANGRFDYRAGETVTFTLGRTTIGSIAGSDVITPLTLLNTSDETDQRVVNLTRLLQSLDADGNPENGIVLDEAVQNAASSFGPINFNQSPAAFALDAAVLGLLRQARGATATLITTERALGHLRDATFRYRYPGIWRLTFTDGNGDFAIDNEGRVRGTAVYQGNTYPLMGYVAGNGGIAIYAADPTLPLVQQYPTAIVTVARLEGRLIDSGSARGTSLILQPSNAVTAGTWTAVRTQPTFDLGIRADLAAIIERFHRTLPMSMRYTLVTEERRAFTGELLSEWWLAQGTACNQRRIGRGQPPAPLPSLNDLRVADSQRFSGVYRQGRGVTRFSLATIRLDSASCVFTITPPTEFTVWRSDPDDTVLDTVLPNMPRPFASAASPKFPLILPQQYGIAIGELSGATGMIDQQLCLWSPNKDGMFEGTRRLQGRNCSLAFDGLTVTYFALETTLRREREGAYDQALPNDAGSTATTTASVSLQLNQPVSDDEVTPPVLRAR